MDQFDRLLCIVWLLAVSKRQKALQKRYEEFVNAVPPTEDRLSLPMIKNAAIHVAKVSSLTYSITDGLKIKVNNWVRAVRLYTSTP